MIIKSSDSVPAKPVTMAGANRVTMQMLLGPLEQCPTFAMRKFTVEPGGFTPHHHHYYEHEVLILAGRGEALTPDGTKALKPGDVVYVPANEMHQFRNSGAVNFEFICLVPARVHAPCVG